jgi:hypothetical protein
LLFRALVHGLEPFGDAREQFVIKDQSRTSLARPPRHHLVARKHIRPPQEWLPNIVCGCFPAKFEVGFLEHVIRMVQSPHQRGNVAVKRPLMRHEARHKIGRKSVRIGGVHGIPFPHHLRNMTELVD